MEDSVARFYDSSASDYRLLFEDRPQSVRGREFLPFPPAHRNRARTGAANGQLFRGLPGTAT